MDYKQLLKNRSSVRVYKDEPVPSSVINEILHDACLAPSASNKQPWRFSIVTDKTFIKQLSDDSKKNILVDMQINPTSAYKTYEAILKDPNFNMFYNAPCLIIISGTNDSKWFYQDCAICASYLMFAAVERGLGTCWIGFGMNIQDEVLRKKLGLAVGDSIAVPIVLGYPKNSAKPTLRKEPVILLSG